VALWAVLVRRVVVGQNGGWGLREPALRSRGRVMVAHWWRPSPLALSDRGGVVRADSVAGDAGIVGPIVFFLVVPVIPEVGRFFTVNVSRALATGFRGDVGLVLPSFGNGRS
jgi:hypothetical protein